MRDRARELRLLLPKVQDNPLAMVALARQLRDAGEFHLALELGARALALSPGDGEARTLATELLSDGVPRWHFAIVRDSARNQAYDAALRRAVFPGCKVLEIGTGSGLLAMMAVRAGAEKVITCEADPAVAAAARDVIAANGLADRVQVINKHSTALDPAADLDGPADVLVSEIVSNDLLGEGVLPAHEHAIGHLLKRGARVIPARGRVRVALAEDSAWAERRLDHVEGFDLTPFNRLARPYREVLVDSPRLALRSEAADLFAFDFASGGPWPDDRTELTLVSLGGLINGISQWIALEMDELGAYEDHPAPTAQSCWSSVFWPFAEPLHTVAGERITVGARHARESLRIWRAQPLI